MLSIKRILNSLYVAAYNTIIHDGIEHAGYLAFLGLLALFPFLVFVVALAGFIGEGQAGSNFIQLVFAQLPPSMVKALQPRVAEIISGPPQGLLTVSILGALWTASSAVEGYRTVLNRAYHVSTPPSYIWRRLLSIAQLLIFSFIVVMSMIVIVLLPIVWSAIENFSGITGTLSGQQLTAISISVIFIIVCGGYYVLPNIKQTLISVAPGAVMVTFLWLMAAQILSLYLSHFQQVNLIYGSLGGIIAALLFFYVSNIIFIFGAEFNYLIMSALGEEIVEKQAGSATDAPLS